MSMTENGVVAARSSEKVNGSVPHEQEESDEVVSDPSKQQTVFGIFTVSTSSKIASLFTNHDFLNLHKILGFTCLAHYAARFYSLVVYGDMFFRHNSLLTWAAPAMHLVLSCSSFIFPVPKQRFGAKPIIWKELQIHNIIFTARSAAIFYYQLLRPSFSNVEEASAEHYLTRLLLVLISHYAADRVTDKLQDRGRTTTRDMPWNEGTPEWLKWIVKKYYAFCQVTAITALLCQRGSSTGQGILEGSFAIMLPIQLSTFLMTLVRKNIMDGSSWHFWYSLSLGSVYLIPLIEGLRNHGTSSAVAASVGAASFAMFASRLMIAPSAFFARITLGLDKYLVMAAITSSIIFINCGSKAFQ